MTDLKISQLGTKNLDGSEIMEVAVAGVGNYQVPVNTVRGIGVGKSMASTYTASVANPVSGLNFKLQRIMRPLSPFAPKLQTFEDDMTQDCGFYAFSGNIGTRTFSNGYLNIASTANTFGNSQNLTSYEKFEFPGFAVSVEKITPTTDTAANVLAIGISKTGGTNQIYAYFEIGSATQNRITIAKTVAGTFAIVQQTAIGSLPAGMTGFCASYEGNSITVWVQVNSGSWYPVMTQSITDWNLLSASELANWSPSMQITGGTTTPWKIGTLRTGYSGAEFFRDYRIVTNKDGTPYVSNGYMYFTASNQYCGIWRLNVKTGKFEKTGGLMFNRGGTLYFDLNAHIVWDQDINKWRVLWATWGNNSFTAVSTYIATYDGDILNGMHVIGNGTQLSLSQGGGTNAVYDACLLYDAALTTWVIAYANSPSGAFGGNMRIAVDTSPDLTTWTSSWVDTTHLNNEGAWVSQVGGSLYVFAGDGTNFNCWSLAGAYLGTITVDVAPPTAGNPPAHFVLFPWMDANTTQYYALSWTNSQFKVAGAGVGTFGTGSPMLYKASQAEAGFEYSMIGGV